MFPALAAPLTPLGMKPPGMKPPGMKPPGMKLFVTNVARKRPPRLRRLRLASPKFFSGRSHPPHEEGQSSVVGPHYWDWSEAVSRQFALGENNRFEVRAEVFNVTNSLRHGNPGIFLSNPNTFGRILCSASSASATGCAAANATPGRSGGPRIVQFALKYVFLTLYRMYE